MAAIMVTDSGTLEADFSPRSALRWSGRGDNRSRRYTVCGNISQHGERLLGTHRR